MGNHPKKPPRVEEAVLGAEEGSYLSNAGRKGAEETHRIKRMEMLAKDVRPFEDEATRKAREAEEAARALQANEHLTPIDDSVELDPDFAVPDEEGPRATY